MKREGADLRLSPSDLNMFLGCRHASALDFRALDEDLRRAAADPTLKFLQDQGIAHERAYLDRLRAEGRGVTAIPDRGPVAERRRLTLEAMRRGDEVIYQAALQGGLWHGYADFLIRSSVPSDLGGWSYDVADTKLSSSVSAYYAVQMTIYCELVAAIQGRLPDRMTVVLGTGRTADLRPADFVHYVRHAQGRLESFLRDEAARMSTVAEPCASCGICPWRERCKAEWQAADHLSLVANIRANQRAKLVEAGVTTLAGLATLPETAAVPGIPPDLLHRLRTQAGLQHSVRVTGLPRFELQDAPAGKGLSRLPKPDAADLFFDMEGDPLYEGRLEYLFGVHVGAPDTGEFKAFWGHDRAGEKRALDEFLDFVAAHLRKHPDAYIYHYNHYEVTAVRRLAMAHGTREAMVDDLLRGKKFVDLLKAVREALIVGESSYSLKSIEHFYMGKRQGEVATAADSIVAYETWRVSGEQRILDEIEEYNAIDCRSTSALRDWLLSIRSAGIPWFDPAVGSDEEAPQERSMLGERLLAGVTEENRSFRQLAADLIDFHRREGKPGWWAQFDRQDQTEEELFDSADSLAGLRLVGEPVPDKRSLLYTYSFPPQETKLRAGKAALVAETLDAAGTIVELDAERGHIVLRKGKKHPLPEALNIGPPGPLGDEVLRQAIERVATGIADRSGRFLAVERLLRRESPGLTAPPPGQDLVSATLTAAQSLDSACLIVQGPPGTGKTYTSSRVIVELLRQGKRIGVSSNSHKAINNLLAGIEKAAASRDFAFRGLKVSSNAENGFDGRMIRSTGNHADLEDAHLIAGTAWTFAREEMEQAIDYLFIDEAGQVSLANVTAMGSAAKNIVLVGDQQQLGQPIQGTHPGESGKSALEYLLDGAATVPPDRGILLDVSWRMHPSLCRWVSDSFYEGRLRSHPDTARQGLLPDDTGLHFLPVAHSGRSQSCPEEAQAIRDIWHDMMSRHWRDRDGAERAITPQDVLVVAPYNAQVNTIREMLPQQARVGTVDKFQGQEAAVAILSMTTSSGEDLPRDIAFLFSSNRLNVAVSRAQCLAIIVASPRLLEVPCNSVDDLRLVNKLCGAVTE